MAEYTVTTEKQNFDTVNDHKMTITVIDPEATVSVYVGDDYFGSCDIHSQFFWNGSKVIESVGLVSTKETKVLLS